MTTMDSSYQEILSSVYDSNSAGITKAELANQLDLSMPTITKQIKQLEEDGYVCKGAARASTGGRKAISYHFNADRALAVGVCVSATEVLCLAVNSFHESVACQRTPISMRKDIRYVQRVGSLIRDFTEKCTKNRVRNSPKGNAESQSSPEILGVSLCLPTQADGSFVFNSEADVLLSQTVPYPIEFMSMWEAYALAEYNADPKLQDAVCIFLEDRLASALIMNGSTPDNYYSHVEHMRIGGQGEQCEVCGATDCFASLCNMHHLSEDGESIPGFFSVLEQGELHHRQRMRDWCTHFAQAITNIRTILPAHIVIGGKYAQFLDTHELEEIQRRTDQSSLIEHDLRLRISSLEPEDAARASVIHIVDNSLPVLKRNVKKRAQKIAVG